MIGSSSRAGTWKDLHDRVVESIRDMEGDGGGGQVAAHAAGTLEPLGALSHGDPTAKQSPRGHRASRKGRIHWLACDFHVVLSRLESIGLK